VGVCVRAAAAPGVPAPSGRRASVQTAAAGAVKAAAVADAPPTVLTAFTPRPITSVLPLERFQLPSGAASASTAAGHTTEVLCAAEAVQRKGTCQATGCFVCYTKAAKRSTCSSHIAEHLALN